MTIKNMWANAIHSLPISVELAEEHVFFKKPKGFQSQSGFSSSRPQMCSHVHDYPLLESVEKSAEKAATKSSYGIDTNPTTNVR